jgi:hypothetical protein
MRVLGVVSFAVRFAWRYAVTAVLVIGLAAAMIEVATSGTAPAPQQPPDGYSAASGRISLEWDKGTRTTPITVQISVDDPSFSKPILDRVVGGGAYTLTDIRPGKAYYWRLVQDGDAGPTANFKVPANYVDL